MTNKSMTSRGFTGWHMLGIMCLFFGVIITVNLTMAYFAIGSWSGLVVKNSYVASQEFNEKAITGKEQAALLWETKLDYKNGEFTYLLLDKDGQAVDATSATAHFKRPVGDANDTTVTMDRTGTGQFASKVELGEGAWIVEINSEAGLEDPYRQIRRFIIVNGEYK
ncbi:FixH family protein [Paenochrobactrum glaciei]|uniref:FixH family protein n=1 Tax=Paenochrobactrum glaciei TaxID=486407 RepID=A0ABP3QKF7_9HYPH